MNTGVRLAEARDIPALTEIWRLCFHDPVDYIRLFYRENFDRITAAVYTVDDRPVSMLHWMDAAIVSGDERREAKYLYAGGTHPAFRGRGCYSDVFAFAKALALQNGYAIFGKPARAELLPYYKAIGLEPNGWFRLVTIRPGACIPLPASPLTPAAYNRMREQTFSAGRFVSWPDRHLDWCFVDNAYFGGKTLAVTLDGCEYFLMGVPDGDMLTVIETNLSLPQLKWASGALCALFGTGRMQAYLPDASCEEGERIVSSIVYNAPLRSTYVNLILI